MVDAIEQEATRCLMRALEHVPLQYRGDVLKQWSADQYWRMMMFFYIEEAHGWANAEAPMKYRPIHTSILDSLRIEVKKKL